MSQVCENCTFLERGDDNDDGPTFFCYRYPCGQIVYDPVDHWCGEFVNAETGHIYEVPAVTAAYEKREAEIDKARKETADSLRGERRDRSADLYER